MELDKDLIRWGLLLGAAPIWVPYLRTLWQDFNHSLRDEGGLIGVPPRGDEEARLRAEKQSDPGSLESRPILTARDRRLPRLGKQGTRAPARPGTPRPSAPRTPGFGRRRP